MAERRVLVCGGRRWEDAGPIHCALNIEAGAFGRLVVIHGAAPGADAIAGKWARDNGHEEEAFPADWVRYGKKAGPIRNQEMLTWGRPDVVLAFPTRDSVGTWDMVNRAGRAGVVVHVLPNGCTTHSDGTSDE